MGHPRHLQTDEYFSFIIAAFNFLLIDFLVSERDNTNIVIFDNPCMKLYYCFSIGIFQIKKFKMYASEC
jgi:hypothetical protein